MSAVNKGVSTGHSSLAQVQGQTNQSLATQQAGAQKGIASAVASSKAGIAQIGKGATKAVQAQHAVAGKALKGNAAQLKKLVGKAYVFKEDAAEVAAELKGGLKQISGKGIVAAGKTAKDAAGAASGASKGAKSGFGAQAHSASTSAASTAGGAARIPRNLVKNNMFGWPSNPVLQPGMIFSDEPGIYIKGEFGIRLEDDMHITADGR